MRKGALSPADVVTALLLIATVGILARPSSRVRQRVELALQLRQVDAAVTKEWRRTLAVAQPLFPGGEAATIVEFTDYECPFCRAVGPSVDSAVSAGVRVAIIHVPLASHRAAMPAARVAICAERLGAFRDVHTRLLSTSEWRTASTAREIALTVAPSIADSLASCAVAPDTDSLLARHRDVAAAVGIPGTPIFASSRGILREAASVASLSRHATE